MRKRESSYEFRERYEDLNRAYKKALSQGHYETQYDAMSVAVDMPSKQFWVSPERLAEVICAIENGSDIKVSRKSPRYEMYMELYRIYTELKEQHPDSTKTDLCYEAVYQPAPKFYMKPSWGLKILYKGREKRRRKHHRRNED